MHLCLQRNNDKTLKNLKQLATHLDITWRPTAPSHSCLNPCVLCNNSGTGWLAYASHNTADPAQTRSYGTWNSMPVRLLREASSVNHNFSERKREKKDRQLDLGFQSIYQTTSEIRCEGPRRVVGATNLTAFWRTTQYSPATEQSHRRAHVRSAPAQQPWREWKEVEMINSTLHICPERCLFVNEPGAWVWNQGASDAAKGRENPVKNRTMRMDQSSDVRIVFRYHREKTS
jgi:hypothetical protein